MKIELLKAMKPDITEKEIEIAIKLFEKIPKARVYEVISKKGKLNYKQVDAKLMGIKPNLCFIDEYAEFDASIYKELKQRSGVKVHKLSVIDTSKNNIKKR